MDIVSLGHSCILLSFQDPDTEESTRILIDPWLSDHATGDAMGRFPRLRFDVEALGNIDALYLSHAHCDHLDPYTLLRLWKELPSPPVLVIPVSLSFLLPLFQKYLNDPEILVLQPHLSTSFRGVELLGFFDVGDQASNEDDVMVLVVTHQNERVLVEADARLSLDLLNFRQYISMLMRDPMLDSAVFLTTENELTGTIESRNCRSIEERDGLFAHAFEEMYAAVHELYAPLDDETDLWRAQNMIRLVHGQGLTAPHELDPRWQRILFPVRIADRVQAERDVSRSNGCLHRIEELRVGYVHRIQGGRVVHAEPLVGLQCIDDESIRIYDGQIPFFPIFPCTPLRSDPRDTKKQRKRILTLLNDFFLPYLHGSAHPPFLHLLAESGGEYRIRIHYGSRTQEKVYDYVCSFASPIFSERESDEIPFQESYWANDIEDFQEGRCDEFSVFCREQFPAASMRLWVAMTMPLLNSTQVYKKIALHFERAHQGQSPGSWVLPFYPKEFLA